MKDFNEPQRLKRASIHVLPNPNLHTQPTNENNHGRITAGKELLDYKFALDESSIVAITDVKGTITYVNNNFCELSKYSAAELIGQDHRIINSGYHPKEYIRNLWVDIANGKIKLAPNIFPGYIWNRPRPALMIFLIRNTR